MPRQYMHDAKGFALQTSVFRALDSPYLATLGRLTIKTFCVWFASEAGKPYAKNIFSWA